MKHFLDIKKWVYANKLEVFIFLGILFLAAFLRFYKIDQYMTFLGDEGRDMLVMKKIWVEHDLPFIGPPTSVGNMYLGPLYYYMMALATGIFWLNPVAAASMDALIGIATVGFIYYLGRIWFGRVAGIISALLYALSPVAVFYAKSSWNPNPAPFFALVSLFGIFKVHRSGNMYWLILSAIGLAFAINMHYLALILIPVVGLLWVYELVLHYRGKLKRKNIVSGTIFSIITFVFLMLPLVLFDLKHNYLNYYAFKALLTNGDAVGSTAIPFFTRIWQLQDDFLISRYFAITEPIVFQIVSVLVVSPLIWVSIARMFGQKLRWPYLGLGVWLLVGLIGLTQYKSSIYDHYLGFLSPAPFLLFGALGALFWGIKNVYAKFGLSFVYGLVFLFIVLGMIQRSPINISPNRQLQRTQAIAREVLNETQGKPYNFALLAKSNYDSAYQFYLEQYGRKPGQLPFEKTDQLFVVCEDEVCQPTTSPKYEIAAFGMSKVEWERKVDGVKLYKLVANPEGKSE